MVLVLIPKRKATQTTLGPVSPEAVVTLLKTRVRCPLLLFRQVRLILAKHKYRSYWGKI